MGALFSFKISMRSTWQSTLAVLMQAMRRVKFVVESTFSFGDFDPNPDYLTSTVTARRIDRARYLKIGKLLWVSVDFRATIGGAISQACIIQLPFQVNATASNTTPRQGGVCYGSTAGTPAPVSWSSLPTAGTYNNGIQFDSINPPTAFAAGVLIIRGNMFLEIQ